MSHACYYCDQFFESKEKLFDHLDIHSESTRNLEKNDKKKELKNKLEKALKEDKSHTKKISNEND